MIVAVLLALRRREGVALTAAMLVTLAETKGLVHDLLDPAVGVTAGRAGHGLVTVR